MPKTAFPSRRPATLLKKANELSILYDAEVGVISFSPDGELHEYWSKSMEQTLERYKKKAGLIELRVPEERRHKPENHEPQERLEALQLEKLQTMGKELDGLSSEEFFTLLEQQTKGLLAVQSKKVELLQKQLQISRSREEQTMHENESLRRRIGGFMMRQAYRPRILQHPPVNYPDTNYENRMGVCTSSRPAVSASKPPSEETKEDLDMTTLRLWP